MSKRKFKVNISFDFELDIDEMKQWRHPKWGYGQYPIDQITVQEVYDELHTCLSHEFAQDEAGLGSLPKDFILSVKENRTL